MDRFLSHYLISLTKAKALPCAFKPFFLLNIFFVFETRFVFGCKIGLQNGLISVGEALLFEF